MTRPLPLAAAALLVAAACSAPEAPQAAATSTPPAAVPQLVPVHIVVPESPDEGISAWAQALAEAITAGHGGLTLAQTPDEALVGVRIDAVEKGTEADPVPEGEGEVEVMRGALLVGEDAHEFNLAYRGDVRPEAEALARNLRKLAVQAATARSAQGAVEGEDETPATESEEDTPGPAPDAGDGDGG